MSEVAAPDSRFGAVLRRIWRLLAVTFAVIAVVLALAIGLFRVLVPLVPDYHQRIEAAASSGLGFPITFDRVDARWRWRGPELVFYGATVIDAGSGDALLNAHSGHVSLDVGAFLRQRAIVPDSVLLRGVALELRRDADGRLSLLGDAADETDAGLLAKWTRWPVNGRFVLRDASLQIVQHGVAPVLVPQIDANLEVRGTRVRLDGKVQPPDTMGDAIEISIELDGVPAQLDAMKAQLYVAGSDVDLSGLNNALGIRRWPVARGRADVVMWLGTTGMKIDNASLEVDATDVVLVDFEIQPAYDRFRGRFEWDRTPLGWRGQAHELFIDRGGVAWPAVEASLTFDRAQTGASRWRLIAPFLRVQDLAPIVRWLPVPGQPQRLAVLQPVGDVEGLEIVAGHGAGEPVSLTVVATLRGLGWDPLNDLPGVQGLSGKLRSDALSGRLELDSDAVTIDAPRVFDDTLTAWRLAGTLLWRQEDGLWSVVGDRVLLATEDFDAVGRLRLDQGADDGPFMIDASVNIGDLDMTRASRYFPVHVMKPKLVNWLTGALQGGTVRSATAVVRGPLTQFPFDQPDAQGEFSAEVLVDDMDLYFADRWPLAREIDARLQFRGRSLTATVDAGRFGDALLESGQVNILDLKNPLLDIETDTRAPVETLVDYFIETPAAERHMRLLTSLKPVGPAHSTFTLSMPLKEWRTFTFDFRVRADGVRLDYLDWPVGLDAVRGDLVVSRTGVDAPDLEAVLMGRPLSARVMTLPMQLGRAQDQVAAHTVVIEANGVSDANVLGERLYAPLAEQLRGNSAWHARIAFPPEALAATTPIEITLDSDLQGLAVLLPEPVAKTADSARPLSATLRIPKEADWQLDLRYGDDLAGIFALGEGASGRAVTRGTIALDGKTPMLGDRPGVAITGATRVFDYDAWQAHKGDGKLQVADLLRTANVTIDELRIFGQTVENAALTVDRNVSEWLIEIDSATNSGAIFLPFEVANGAQVIANMQQLTWRSDGEGGDSVDPRRLPNIRLDAQMFIFNDMRFGALSLLAAQAEDGLRIERIQTQSPSFSGSGDGVWRHAAGQPSDFNFTLQSTDVKTTLEELDTVGSIDADQATFGMQLHWDNALDSNFIREVYGEVTVRVGDGQLINVDPKAGRVFGLISLTALPRRLSLDFRDIFQKGFAFDAIEGDFSLRNGSAFTDNLTLTGPAAQVAVVGRAGIADRDYDQTASIFANFGSSLPIAGALAAGPAVGAALLIFSELFKDPLKEMGRVDYHIGGSWDEPQIARLGAAGPVAPEPVAPQQTPDPAPPVPATPAEAPVIETPSG